MDTVVDPKRHLAVFNPELWGDRRVDVVGAGATGSRVILELARLGIRSIHAWDFDIVESHNIANQAFGLPDIGKPKVEAIASLAMAQTGIQIFPHTEKVDGSQKLGSVVFLLTDTMASRKEIFQKGVKFKPSTHLMIETRMGTDQGRVYVIDPRRPQHIRGYEATLYSDEKAEVSACGTRVSLGATAGHLACLAVFQLVRFFAIERGDKEDTLDNEIIYGLRPNVISTKRF